jgi:deoxycytidylate deaminase
MFLNFDVFQTKECKDKQDLYMQKAANAASHSNIHNHRHGCVIVNRRTSEIVAEGFNHYSEHLHHLFSIHAEVDALLKIKRYPKHLVHELDLYVVRIGTDRMGNPLKYSKPCTSCTQAIMKTGIRKVYFSTDENYLNNMNNVRVHPSYCQTNKKYECKYFRSKFESRQGSLLE